ncbi:unnamed protein product [Linum trigynum]|uniref:Uncharacterized protein n=1 Tax=Linum trigynum TaxID=586398 RepID=A0AAV2G3Z8_9ROSI
MRFHQAAAAVWDEPGGGGGNSSPTPPKLSLFSLPAGVKGSSSSVRHCSPGPPPSTPPINRLASVPFKWEEAPGKPRPPRRLDHHRHVTDGESKVIDRCLELPPRLVVSNLPPSPACLSLRQGEDEGNPAAPRRSMSFTSGSGRSPPPPPTGRVFGSSRWGNLVTKMTSSTAAARNKKDQQQVANFDSTEINSYVDDDDQRNVKMTRMIIRRRRSLFNLSAASRPQACLNSMYRSFKKMMMVPTRRR